MARRVELTDEQLAIIDPLIPRPLSVHTPSASPHEVSLVTNNLLEYFVDDAIENDTMRDAFIRRRRRR
jgi:hypothetical protein